MKKTAIALAVSVLVVLFAISCASSGSAAAEPVKEVLPVASAAADMVLDAATAELESGGEIRYENESNIGWWSKKGDIISWPFNVADAGEYIVKVKYSADGEFAGNTVKVAVGDASLAWTVASTQTWGNYVDLDLGTLALAAGPQKISFQATEIKTRFVANLKTVTLSKKK